jgi:hypothetical protein
MLCAYSLRKLPDYRPERRKTGTAVLRPAKNTAMLSYLNALPQVHDRAVQPE